MKGGMNVYANYSKLWKLLLDKNLTKTELCEITGISSRTVAKLVKNQSVTTDTLIRICEVLDCELCDIMELCREEPEITLYNAFKQHATLIGEDENCRLYELTHRDRSFLIKVVKKSANSHVLIHCRGSSVTWEQFHPSGISPARTVTHLTNFSFVEKDKICMLLIGGSNVGITGLDDGAFLSPARPYEPGKLYVMSKTKFKLFQPK